MQQRILDAALEVLRTQGPEALTVRAVTELAGCSTTGVYTHFGSKNGLVEAIFVDGFESFDRHVMDNPTTDFREAGLEYREWALANRTHYLVMFACAVPDFEPSMDAALRAKGSFDGLVAAMKELGADDPIGMAYHFWATIHGYVMLELAGSNPHVDGDLRTVYEHGLDLLATAFGD